MKLKKDDILILKMLEIPNSTINDWKNQKHNPPKWVINAIEIIKHCVILTYEET